MKLYVHDVLQDGYFSISQLRSIEERGSFYDQFCEAMPYMDGAVMVCIASGIGNREWVELIKPFEIQLHGLNHIIYPALSEEDMYSELSMAKKLLEETFERKITQFHPPKGKCNPILKEICGDLDLEVKQLHTCSEYLAGEELDEVYEHFWGRGLKKLYDFRKKRCE
jgi:peptidoglycan/xylan/chitin deacetylase (PgdA/CDA1 family)